MVFAAFWLPGQPLRYAKDGIVSGAVSGRLRPIEDGPDPLLDPSRRLRFREPDGGKELTYFRGLDLVDPSTADDGKSIFRERVEPLGGVLSILSRQVCAPYEPCEQPLQRSGRTRVPCPLRGHRRPSLPSQRKRLLPRFGEGYKLRPAKAEVTAAALNDGPQDPSLRPGRVHHQVETVAVRIASGSETALTLTAVSTRSGCRPLGFIRVPHSVPHPEEDVAGCQWKHEDAVSPIGGTSVRFSNVVRRGWTQRSADSLSANYH